MANKICNNCGAELIEGASFCRECGWKVPPEQSTVVCPNCGKTVPNHKFCRECGQNFESAPVTAVPVQQVPVQQVPVQTQQTQQNQQNQLSPQEQPVQPVQPVQPAVPVYGGYTPAPVKKSGGAGKLIAVIAVLLALVAIAIAVVFLLNNDSGDDDDDDEEQTESTGEYAPGEGTDPSGYPIVDPDDIPTEPEVTAPEYTQEDTTMEATEPEEETLNPKPENIRKGDTYIIGSFDQDNDASNGAEAIEWIVLEVRNGKALMISKYGLDGKPYNIYDKVVTWETCTLRDWLNGDFYNDAFSYEEKSKICLATVYNNTGNTTKDYVYLLSTTEAETYFNSNDDRICEVTDYAVANGSWESENGHGWWWLRSSGTERDSAIYIRGTGGIGDDGHGVYHDNGTVRPVIWVDLYA